MFISMNYFLMEFSIKTTDLGHFLSIFFQDFPQMAYLRLLDTNFSHEMLALSPLSPGKVLEQLWKKGLILEANLARSSHLSQNI